MAIITISRGSLSGGRAVAECLAERLGYPCVAREILREAALELGVSREAIRDSFEAPPRLWARLRGEREIYVLAVQAALAARCAEGRLVYHGLAGQFLLRGLRGVLRVRLIAGLDQRISALRKHHRMSRSAAAELIENVDAERRRWVRQVYGVDVDDELLYDMTVRLRTLSRDSACQLIAEAASQPQYEITAEVKAELAAFAKGCQERLQARLALAGGVLPGGGARGGAANDAAGGAVVGGAIRPETDADPPRA